MGKCISIVVFNLREKDFMKEDFQQLRALGMECEP